MLVSIVGVVLVFVVFGWKVGAVVFGFGLLCVLVEGMGKKEPVKNPVRFLGDDGLYHYLPGEEPTAAWAEDAYRETNVHSL